MGDEVTNIREHELLGAGRDRTRRHEHFHDHAPEGRHSHSHRHDVDTRAHAHSSALDGLPPAADHDPAGKREGSR